MILKLKKSEKNKPTKYIALGSDKKKFEFTYSNETGVTCDKRKMEIEIDENDDGFIYILWKNKKFAAEVVEKSQNKYHVIINGLSYNFSIETPISYKRKKFLDKNKKGSTIESVSAPMPGKIVEILVENNEVINEGEPVLILEAMKMQNEIVSNTSGTVLNINVKKDDNVMKDDVLLEIQK